MQRCHIKLPFFQPQPESRPRAQQRGVPSGKIPHYTLRALPRSLTNQEDQSGVLRTPTHTHASATRHRSPDRCLPSPISHYRRPRRYPATKQQQSDRACSKDLAQRGGSAASLLTTSLDVRFPDNRPSGRTPPPARKEESVSFGSRQVRAVFVREVL